MILASAARLFFHWPDGGVWSNLVASFLWATPLWVFGFWRLHRAHRRLHGTVAELHEKLDRLNEKLDQ